MPIVDTLQMESLCKGAYGSSVCAHSRRACWMFQPRLKGPSSDEHFAQPLPPIAESCAVDPGWAVRAQTQKAARPSAETFGCQSQENLNQLHQQLLFPPLLFPGKEGKKKHAHRSVCHVTNPILLVCWLKDETDNILFNLINIFLKTNKTFSWGRSMEL